MRIGIATDHGGFGLKEDLLGNLSEADYEVVDFGAHSLESADDYPDFVIPLARSVAAGNVDRGIAICGSGVGASIAANKIHGARAALILDHFSARQGVEDDQEGHCPHDRLVARDGDTIAHGVKKAQHHPDYI